MRSPLEPTNCVPSRSRYGAPCAALSALLFASAAAPQSGSQPSAANPANLQAQPAPVKAAPAPKIGSLKPKTAGTPTRYLPNRFGGRAGLYYKTVWGVDSLNVKLTESGQIIRFTWRVLDPGKAKPLSDKLAKPSLIDPQVGVSLSVPTLENLGMMRQASDPEEGKAYWMAFSNKGRLVKKGDRVNVVIGQFRADGLAVDD